MSELWGFQAGQSIRRQEDSRQALADLALRKGEVDIQNAQVDLQQSELTLQSQKKMIELMQGRESEVADQESGSQPLSGRRELEQLPDKLDSLASMALSSGLPQQAAEYASKASTMRSNASEIAKRQSDQKLQELELAANLLYNVTDETSWRKANSLFEMTAGKKSPFASQDYSPELVEQALGSVLTQKDRATRDAANARADASVAATKTSEARIPLIRAQQRLTETRDLALRKAGAVTVMPKAEDIRAVSDIINAEYMGAVTPEDARILARPVAERMKQLMISDNLPRSQAAQRAFIEAQANGDFGGLRKRSRMPGSQTSPLPIPGDKAKLRSNMYYQGAGKYAGKTLLWTGTGFKLASPAAAAAAASRSGPPVDRQGEEVFDNEHTEEIED